MTAWHEQVRALFTVHPRAAPRKQRRPVPSAGSPDHAAIAVVQEAGPTARIIGSDEKVSAVRYG